MTLYASVLSLDHKAILALRITDPYSVHRTVYSLFPMPQGGKDNEDEASGRLLYADMGGDARSRCILMLSDRRPTSAVQGDFGTVQCKPIEESFLQHETYRFKVIVNPTRRDSKSRKIVPVKGHGEIANWFDERARAAWGFSAERPNLQVERVEVLQFKDKHQRPVTIAQAHLQGILRVTNAVQFKESFSRGIGRGRAFGCGLLQIVPIVENNFA